MNNVKVYILQPTDSFDDIPEGEVYGTLPKAIQNARLIIQHGNVVGDLKKKASLKAIDTWDGQHALDFYNSEGQPIARLYSTVVQ